MRLSVYTAQALEYKPKNLVEFTRRKEDCILYFVNGLVVSEVLFNQVLHSRKYLDILSYKISHNKRELLVQNKENHNIS